MEGDENGKENPRKMGKNIFLCVFEIFRKVSTCTFGMGYDGFDLVGKSEVWRGFWMCRVVSIECRVIGGLVDQCLVGIQPGYTIS